MLFDRRKFLQNTSILSVGSLMPFNKIIGKEETPISIDFSHSIGKIKLIHGVNGGPFDYSPASAPLASYHAEAGFPYTRLHDANWPHADAVDIHTIFPLFETDVDDPKNYYFKKTDDYILPIIQNQSEIIYRLGESIEHLTRYFIYPPKDFQKWAKICVNIIRHYNDGWANGFHYNIKYWEIWNEPEGKNMWLGTDLQYFELYKAATTAIKKYNPLLKVGGPASTSVKSKLVKPFLSYCRDQSLPLDFFSWHLYTHDIKEIVDNTKLARNLLNEYNFKDTKSFLDEWHYRNIPWRELFPGNINRNINIQKYEFARNAFSQKSSSEINGIESAVFTATALILLQDCPIDATTFYNADYYNPFSMFDSYGIPGKAFYVFKAFNQLAKMHNRVSFTSDSIPNDDKPTLLAGVSEDTKNGLIFISNSSSYSRSNKINLENFPSSKNIHADIYLIDRVRNLEKIGTNEISLTNPILKLMLPPSSVCLIKLKGN